MARWQEGRGYNDIMPLGVDWIRGERYDILTGQMRYINRRASKSRVPVWIRDNSTGKIVKRVGTGDYYTVTINWKGKPISLDTLLSLKR
jgi:hypothetical protein